MKRPYDAIPGFPRHSMQRRIFAFFGAGIIISMLTFTGVARVVDGVHASPWRKEMSRVHALLSSRFEKVWDDPVAREELARTFSDTMELQVRLFDARSQALGTWGECTYELGVLAVDRGGERLGTVELCAPQQRWGTPFRFLLPLGLAGLVLWALSGVVARKAGRPLLDLARTAQDIGAGNLQARSSLATRRYGEVGALAHVLNDMAAKIEKQMADQRQLLAAVSHELRTPLARIRILTELGRDKLGPDKTWEEVDREVGELDALVGDLLANSRLEFTALTVRGHDAVELAARALERAGLPRSMLSAPAGPLELRGDATLLARALSNLVDNAQGHAGGATALHVEDLGDRVRFEVEDRGPGFSGPPEKAFEAFTQGGEGEHGALGLGLALVRRISQAHGGTAWARNRDGGGAVVGFDVAKDPPPPRSAVAAEEAA